MWLCKKISGTMPDKLSGLLTEVQTLVESSYTSVKGGSATEVATLLDVADKIVREVKPRYVVTVSGLTKTVQTN
jgi:hypothetical protein